MGGCCGLLELCIVERCSGLQAPWPRQNREIFRYPERNGSRFWAQYISTRPGLRAACNYSLISRRCGKTAPTIQPLIVCTFQRRRTTARQALQVGMHMDIANEAMSMAMARPAHRSAAAVNDHCALEQRAMTAQHLNQPKDSCAMGPDLEEFQADIECLSLAMPRRAFSVRLWCSDRDGID